MNKEKVALYGLFGGLAILIAYAGYKIYSNVILLKQTDVSLADVKFDSSNPDAWKITFVLNVHNKSSIDIEVTGYSFDFKINNALISKIANTTAQYIAAEKTSQLDVVATLNPKTVWKDFANIDFLKNLLGNYKNMTAGISGHISAVHQVVKLSDIPINYTVKLGDYI